MDAVKVGLLGLGTVGAGAVTVLKRNAEEITRRAGRGIQVTHAAAPALPSQPIPMKWSMILMCRSWWS